MFNKILNKIFNKFKFIFIGIIVLLAFNLIFHGLTQVRNPTDAPVEDIARQNQPEVQKNVKLMRYLEELSSLNQLVVDHQKDYGNVDSYSDKHIFSIMDTYNLLAGELFMFSHLQYLNPQDALKVSTVKKDMDYFNKNQVKSDNNYLVTYIRQNWIRDPSTLEYNLHKPEHVDHSMGQSLVVDHILGKKTGGFFIECGALDGETRSNSLFFERFRGWTGLLIEADPINYQQMLKRNRHAYVVPSCIAVTDYPAQVNFFLSRNEGTITTKRGTTTQCFPLYSLLLALNVTTVDFFSLDVEGAELKVLKTIPFDKLDIKVLAVEFSHTFEGKKTLNTFLHQRGFISALEVKHNLGAANDIIFIKDKYVYSILAKGDFVNLDVKTYIHKEVAVRF